MGENIEPLYKRPHILYPLHSLFQSTFLLQNDHKPFKGILYGGSTDSSNSKKSLPNKDTFTHSFITQPSINDIYVINHRE